ncbi:MAG: hypothetical protein EBU90_17085 [Proteobacteria bacterium]|nr:hypothetical protein [Pseudomonadota bacterium]NBP16811.1 hypothetical protein [bacterium]
MKKQLLIIALLFVSVNATKSNETKALGFCCAALTAYGFYTAERWSRPDQDGAGAVQTNGEVTAKIYGVTFSAQWGNPDHNAPGLCTALGEIAGTTGHGFLKATNVAGCLAAGWLLFPEMRCIINPAAAVGIAYLAGNRLFLGANQETRPTDVNTGTAMVCCVLGLGTLYKINAFPPLNGAINRALGIKPAPVSLFSRLFGR